MIKMKCDEKKNEKKKITKSGKNPNAYREGKFQVLGDIGSEHYKTEMK